MEILEQKKINFIVDATMFSTLQACGEKGNLRHNLNIIPIGGKSNSLECGSIIHAILERFYKELKNGAKRNDAIDRGMEDGRLYIKGCPYCSDDKPSCGHQTLQFPGVRNTPPENQAKPHRTGWKWVLETMVQYFDFYRNDSWIPIEVEYVKGVVIYEDDEIRIMWKAKTDLLAESDNGNVPVDHKSYSREEEVVELVNQFKGLCIVHKTRNIVINRIGLQTSKEPKEKFKRPMISYSLDSLTEFATEYVPFWVKVFLMYDESGYYPRNYTQCRSKFGLCEYYKICKSNRNMRGQEIKDHYEIGKPWDIQNVEDEQ